MKALECHWMVIEVNKANLFLCLVAVLVLIAGCTGQQGRQAAGQGQQNESTVASASSSGASKTVTVEIKDSAFTPSTATIKAGGKVKWSNKDSVDHTIKMGSYESTRMSQGLSFTYEFKEKGTYDYICGLHPSMRGTIVVE
ncbi:cupredoxin family copper-binding protein [Candidatus Micrarchaeota archaeon]|nr:cupredoxin family copper-binding protein [Candidatus Micrarchaeota archaeon]